MTKQKFSNTKINKIGEKIRTDNFVPKNSTLSELQDFRTSHKDSLSAIFQILLKIKKSINKESIITYRIKRFESILGKLKRYKKNESQQNVGYRWMSSYS